MKWFAAALVTALLLLQYRLWFSGDGVSEVLRLRGAVASQQTDNQRLSDRNRQLAAEVGDLKHGDLNQAGSALQERARTDLGMVGSNETFYQVVPGDAATAAPAASGAGASPATRTAAR